MPLTVPLGLIPSPYHNDTHFRNVLEHLFIPSVRKAGFEPILPIAKGADLIIAEIIHHLSKSEMVLCDISTHNPNVFYELGIRTALDKPVALIRDEVTHKIPFDTSAINIETYPSDLRPWNISSAIDRLSLHITDTLARSGGRNSAWKYFGIKDQAEFDPQKNTAQDKLDVILSRLDSIETIAPKRKPKEGQRPFLTKVEDYLLNGRSADLVGCYIEYDGVSGKIEEVDLRSMIMYVLLKDERHKFVLRHADVLKLDVLPF